MKQLGSNNILRYFWGLLSLLFLNTSIDTPDTHRFDNNPATINEQESILELVLEKGFLLEDIVSEYDDEGTNESYTKKGVVIDSFLIPSCSFSFPEQISFKKEKHVKLSPLVTGGFLDIYSPPPES